MAIKQPSAARSEAARRNGAKSRGPSTPNGKSRSAQNALKHGLASKTVVLQTESQDSYQQFAQTYLDFYHPADLFEQDRVTDIVESQWRLRRILFEQTAIRDIRFVEIEAGIRQQVPAVTDAGIHAAAFAHISDNTDGLYAMHRYESYYRRTIRNAETDLFSYRAAKAAGLPYEPRTRTRRAIPAISQNEPEPSPTPPPPTQPATPQNEPKLPFWKRLPLLVFLFLLLGVQRLDRTLLTFLPDVPCADRPAATTRPCTTGCRQS